MTYVTAVGLPPGGTFTHKQYTERQKNKQYIKQHKHLGTVRAVPRLGELYPGIFLTTEEKARKTLGQGI
jgi:hypothetical protein